MEISLFYYWAINQWLELIVVGLLLFFCIDRWSWLWIKTWPAKNKTLILLFTLISVVPYLGKLHHDLCMEMVEGKYGKYVLQQGVERMPNRNIYYDFQQIAHESRDKEDFIGNAIAKYSRKLYESNQVLYLPIDNWPAHVPEDEKIRNILSEIYDCHEVSEYSLDNRKSKNLFDEICQYLLNRQLVENDLKLKEGYPNAIPLFVVVILIILIISAQMAYHSVAKEYRL